MSQMEDPPFSTYVGEKRGYRFLSLDASTYALCQIYVLRELFHRLKHDLQSTEDLRPSDWFDMMIGSGQGGLLAILLGRLHMTVSQALMSYHKLIKALTDEPTSSLKGKKKSMELFIVAFTNVLGTVGLDKDTLLEDGGVGPCRVIIYVLDKYTYDGKNLRSFPYRNETPSGSTILQAACATVADLEIYAPVNVGSDSLCYSARIRFPNPVLQLLRQAKVTYGDNAKVASIISVGSGQKSDDNCGDIETIFQKIATDTEAAHQAMIEGKAGSSKIYTRHNSHYAQIHMDPARAKSSVLSSLEAYEGGTTLDLAVSTLLPQEGRCTLEEINVNPFMGNGSGNKSTQTTSINVEPPPRPVQEMEHWWFPRTLIDLKNKFWDVAQKPRMKQPIPPSFQDNLGLNPRIPSPLLVLYAIRMPLAIREIEGLNHALSSPYFALRRNSLLRQQNVTHVKKTTKSQVGFGRRRQFPFGSQAGRTSAYRKSIGIFSSNGNTVNLGRLGEPNSFTNAL